MSARGKRGKLGVSHPGACMSRVKIFSTGSLDGRDGHAQSGALTRRYQRPENLQQTVKMSACL